MRILFLCPIVPYPPTGGGVNRMFYLIRELAAADEVDVLCFANEEGSGSLKELGRFCRKAEAVKTPSRFSDLAYKFFFLKAYARVPEMFRRLKEILKENSYDAVIAEKFYMAPYVEKATPCPVAIDLWAVGKGMEREIQLETDLFKKSRALWQKKKFERYDAFGFRHFKNFLVVSNVDRDRALQLNPMLRVAVVPNAVDCDYFEPNNALSRQPQLIFTGDMGFKPNIDAALYFCREIFPIIKRNFPSAVFKIVGKNPVPEIAALRTSDIVVTGFVEDIRPHLAEAAVFVAPLRQGAGTRLKILEAMAMAKAVVTTSVGIEGIEAKPGKEICVEEKPDSFAEAAVSLLKNPDLAKQMGQRARLRIESQYTWKESAQKLRQFLQKIAAEK